MTTRRLLLLSIVVPLLSSCTANSPDDLIDPLLPVDNITYNEHIQPIIAANCTHCHGSIPQNGAPMPLITYANVKQALLERGLSDRISRQNGETGLMPLGGPRLPQHQIDLITEWNNDGLLEQ